VGDVGLGLKRAPYYGKELELRLARSYGPGRYDTEYEERGLDYPLGYVRWTERRNLQAFVGLLAAGRLNVTDLITHRFAVDEAREAYATLMSAESSPLAMVLSYEPTPLPATPVSPAHLPRWLPVSSAPATALIGAGSFAQGTVAPGLRRAGFRLTAVASASGRSAHAARDHFAVERLLAPEEILGDPSIEVVAVLTRHASHAAYATAALRAEKAVFVEKPACLTWDELEELEHAAAQGPPLLVGFNRRYAPLARRMREHIAGRGHPVELLCRVNAGRLAEGHWLNDPVDGGGRLIGEGCHFIDFACWFLGALPRRVSTVMRAAPGESLAVAQSFSVALDFEDGSLATILYGAGGSPALGKEYLEAHAGGRSAVLDDFTQLVTYDGRKKRTRRERGHDKGHEAQFRHFAELVRGVASAETPTTLETMAVTLAALRSATTGVPSTPARREVPYVGDAE
jgi:predicted dehydrogenase